MPKNNVLYCKGMDMSESESEAESGNDQWDDRALNNAYDKALKLANVEVAKRLAMSTNSKNDGKEKATSKHSSKTHSKNQQWSTGMPCRAVYEEDGMEYEALVLRILNDKECIVKFLGYGNSEQVKMSTMKPSHGREAQEQQIEQALLDGGDETDATIGTDAELLSGGHSTDRSFRSKEPKKKKRDTQQTHVFNLPNVPMPDMSKLRNMASMDIPMPPPLPFLSGPDGEEQAVSSMLLSWYMSGYYTGLYQGLKRSKKNKRHKN